MEADLVAHIGPTARGSFVQTLTVTDIATGWTECAPVLVREQSLLTAVLRKIRKVLPLPLLGLDTDNDSVFLNETVVLPHSSMFPNKLSFASTSCSRCRMERLHRSGRPCENAFPGGDEREPATLLQ